MDCCLTEMVTGGCGGDETSSQLRLHVGDIFLVRYLALRKPSFYGNKSKRVYSNPSSLLYRNSPLYEIKIFFLVVPEVA